MAAHDAKLYVELGERMRLARERRRRTLEDVAEQTGISVKRLLGIEAGERKATVDEVFKICLALNISINLLMHGGDQVNRPETTCPLYHKPNET